jgi:hypothetical protein
MSIKSVELAELRKMENTEGLLLQGCGGDLKEWLDGINNMFQEADILLENTKFEEDDCLVFKNGEITCLLFKFTENTTIDMAKLAMWRLQTHSNFAGMWFSDYVDNRLGGFSNEEQPKEKKEEKKKSTKKSKTEKAVDKITNQALNTIGRKIGNSIFNKLFK